MRCQSLFRSAPKNGAKRIVMHCSRDQQSSLHFDDNVEWNNLARGVLGGRYEVVVVGGFRSTEAIDR